MNNLDRLIKAEGVQGGTLAHYEARFRKFADIRLDSDDNPLNLLDISDKMLTAHNSTGSQEAFDLYVLARRAQAAHLTHKRIATRAP